MDEQVQPQKPWKTRLIVSLCGIVAIAAITLCIRSFWYYDGWRTIVGGAMVELKSSRSHLSLEWSNPWPNPGEVVTTWEHWSISEYPAPDIQTDNSFLGFGFESKNVLVVSQVTIPATQPEEEDTVTMSTTPVGAFAVMFPVWLFIAVPVMAIWSLLWRKPNAQQVIQSLN